MKSSDFTSCPRTKAKTCECSSLSAIQEAQEVVKAVAQLEHTEVDISGAIVMKQDPGKPTIIRGIIKGLTPGKHGFHVHEFGDLSKGCESAGGHYNPEGVDHGGLSDGHIGDLGNIVANDDGIARFKIVARRIDLSGDRSIVGRAIVIHADEDDLGTGGDDESLKTGNAGDRLACGVIRLRQGIEEDYQRVVGKKHFDRNQLPQIKRHHIQNSDLNYKEGMISIDKIIPVQTQRVKGLAKKSQDVFLNDEDRPFIVDRKGYLINGHHRFDAANVLGIKKVPAIMIDADIEDVMDKFKDETSDTKVMKENYFKNLLQSKMEENVSFVKPQLDVEWGEAERYPEFQKIGKEAWIELAKKGKEITITDASDINNTDAADINSFKSLDNNKQKRALAQLEKGSVEMPIVAVYSDGYKELIGGNTRLTAMMAKDGKATVWQFEVPDEVAELAENFADGTLYHATYKPLLKSIQANGLGGGGAQTKWTDSKPGVVYLAKDPDVAVSYAETSDEVPEEWLDQIVVLAISTDSLDTSKLKDDENVLDDDSTLEYHGVIKKFKLGENRERQMGT